jgi:hypothetical protein
MAARYGNKAPDRRTVKQRAHVKKIASKRVA